MVSRVTVHDDLTDEPNATTRTFGVAGHEYEIDLTDANHDELVAALAPWIDTARQVGKRAEPRGVTPPVMPTDVEHDAWYRASADDTYSEAKIKKGYRADVAEWAKRAGYETPRRGRLQRSVYIAYERAHGVDPRRARLAELRNR